MDGRMKQFVAILVALLFFVSENFDAVPIPANITVFNYRQKIDHFSFVNNNRFDQRVILSTDHWGKEGSPIFIYAGNEGDIFMFANNTGFMWENAKDFRAMVIFLEHRYYGTSMPFGNSSFDNLQNLGFLTASQALADLAEFITHVKTNYGGAEKSPFIMFGGSYGGMMASWFRMKYPHLIEGAVAGSAPIFQFPGIYNCSDYYKIITRDFENYNKSCSDSIRNSWPAIRRLGNTAEGKQWLHDTFKQCPDEPIKSDEDLESFVVWLSSTYDNLAMTDYPNPAQFLSPLPAYPMKEVCRKLLNPNASDKELLTDIFRGVSVYYNYTGLTKCNTRKEDGMLRGWSFQSCTEMVMPVCSDGVNDMFEKKEWNMNQVTNDCIRRFNVTPDASRAEMLWGGRNIRAASNIIFSNGDRDPWSAGGVLEDVNDSIHVIKIPNACHHEDLRATGPNDPSILKEVRQKEIKIIRRWINEYYLRMKHFPQDWINASGCSETINSHL